METHGPDDPYYHIRFLAGLTPRKPDPDFDIDEDKYFNFCEKFFQPERFVQFLQETLCTYPATNDFLIKCLAVANKEQQHFDT